MDTIDEVIQNIGKGDQAAAGVAQTAYMTSEMFKELRKRGVGRVEALALTQTWLAGLMAAAAATHRR